MFRSVAAVVATTVATALTFLPSCGGRSMLTDAEPAPIVDASSDVTHACLGGSIACGGSCVDLRSDNANCGGCEDACAPGLACADGTCVQACPPPQTVCRSAAGATYCATIATDPANCGACEHRCAAGDACANGACVSSCPANLTTCAIDGGASEACVDTAVDPANCGSCGNSCDFAHTTGTYCSAGICNIATCDSQFVDCDGVATNGCECLASACFKGVCSKRVFVTSETYASDLGGLDGADLKCQARADAVGLGGTYRAWLSDSTGSPSTRFRQSSVPYVLVDGTVVANDWADLTDLTIASPIDLTEIGGTPPLDDSGCASGNPTQTAWSDTWATGTYLDSFADCDDWSSTTAFSGYSGVTTAENWWWSTWCQMGCDRHSALFCFEQ